MKTLGAREEGGSFISWFVLGAFIFYTFKCFLLFLEVLCVT